MSTFTPNTLAVYTAKNKTQKLVKILGYTKGKNPDILRVIALQEMQTTDSNTRSFTSCNRSAFRTLSSIFIFPVKGMQNGQVLPVHFFCWFFLKRFISFQNSL